MFNLTARRAILATARDKEQPDRGENFFLIIRILPENTRLDAPRDESSLKSVIRRRDCFLQLHRCLLIV